MKSNANQATLSVAGAKVSEVSPARRYSVRNGSQAIASHRMSSRELLARVKIHTMNPANSGKHAKHTFTPFVRTVNSLSEDARKNTIAQRSVAYTERSGRDSTITRFAGRSSPVSVRARIVFVYRQSAYRDHSATYSSKRPVASRSRSYRFVSGNGGN